MDKVHNKLQKKLLHLQATAKTGIWNSTYRKQLEVNATKQCQLTESTSMRDTLHWLSHPQPVIYKLCLLTYKCLHGLAPQYLSQLFPLLHDLNLSLALSLSLSLSLTLDPCWRLCWQLWFFLRHCMHLCGSFSYGITEMAVIVIIIIISWSR